MHAGSDTCHMWLTFTITLIKSLYNFPLNVGMRQMPSSEKFQAVAYDHRHLSCPHPFQHTPRGHSHEGRGKR